MDMANYSGIRLIIEYAVDLEKPEWTVYDVWLTDDADLVREYQYSDYIQCPIEAEEIQLKILEHANRWQCLFEAVAEFTAKLRHKRAPPSKSHTGKHREYKPRRTTKA